MPIRSCYRWFAVLSLLLLPACMELLPSTAEPTVAREPEVIEIMPPAGVSPPMARLLAASLTEALADRAVPVRLNEGSPPRGDTRMVVTGEAVTGDTAGDGRVATLDWRVHGRGEAVPVATARLPVYGKPADWAYGSPALIEAIGQRTADMLVEALDLSPVPIEVESAPEPESEPEAEADSVVAAEPELEMQVLPDPVPEPDPTVSQVPVQPAALLPPPKLWVDDVTGAPGDGNASLTRALTGLLRSAGYPLARTPSSAEYYVQAVVDVSVIDHSTETVEIVWSMVGRDGEEKGKITQRNDIPRGMLHGEWGETARYAALGGFEGVRAILYELGYEAPEP